MNLFFRLLKLFLSRPFRRPLKPADASVLNFTVFPNDLDIYLHMNNGRYLTLMDLGRMDWIWRTGIWRTARKNRWAPLVAASTIRYRKSLRLGQYFSLHTRIIGWDHKWFYIEQLFKRGDRLMASATVLGLFRGPHGNVSPREILQALGAKTDSPEIPESVRLWMQSQSIA